jgi:hypothetical protein
MTPLDMAAGEPQLLNVTPTRTSDVATTAFRQKRLVLGIS